MKATLIILTVVFILFFSCKKSTVSAPVTSADTTISVLRKWNIVTDSTFLQYFLAQQPTISVYIGVSTDYYDFRKNDSLYIKEGNQMDTLKYWFPSGYPQPIATDRYAGNILNLTDSTMELGVENNVSTPEFSTSQIINLKR